MPSSDGARCSFRHGGVAPGCRAVPPQLRPPWGVAAELLCDEPMSASSLLPAPARFPGVVERFHPAVRTWFERRFPDGPTDAQLGGWPAILSGRHTLICAPTGSGKTLAGFLAAIDALYHAREAGEEIEGSRAWCISVR